MSPNQWGPAIWTFFHTLAEKIKEDKFGEVGPQLFGLIRKICTTLPCPDCSRHATNYLSRVKFSTMIKSKDHFRGLIHHFHNTVNKRKKKPEFAFSEISAKYGNTSLIGAFNHFLNSYNTHGNMRIMTDSFQRKIIIRDTRLWILANIQHFQH